RMCRSVKPPKSGGDHSGGSAAGQEQSATARPTAPAGFFVGALLRLLRQCPGAAEDGIEHGCGKAAGKCILLAGVVRPEEMIGPDPSFRSVSKARFSGRTMAQMAKSAE